MGLYDIFGEIAQKQALKTETGDSRIWGAVTGVVAKNYHKDMPGRVCVTIPVRDGGANELKWARVAMLSGGANWGHYFLPEVGDQVLLVFEDGNIEKPYVIGCICKQKDKFLKDAADENNRYKQIVTKNGSCIVFEDDRAGEGEKDKLLFLTAGERQRLTFDNENSLITLSDKENNNQLELNTKDGRLRVKTEKRLELVLGGNDVKVTMDAEAGSLKIKCRKFDLECDDAVRIRSSGRLRMEGENVTVSGTSVMKIEGSGMTGIEGRPIRLG